MKKTIAVMLSVIMAITLMAGCYKGSMSLKINSDGTSSLGMIMKIDMNVAKEIMSEEAINETFKEMVDAARQEGVSVKEYSETVNGHVFKCASLTENFKNLKKLNKEIFLYGLFYDGFASSKFVYFFTDGMAEDIMVTDAPNYNILSDSIEMKFKITLPDKIVYTNGVLSDDGYTAEWDLMKIKGNYTIIAASDLKAVKTTTPSGVRAKRNGKKATIKWNKSYGVSGYQVQAGTNKKATKGKRAVNVNKNKAKAVVKKLKNGKKYYVKVRSYIVINNKKYYGGWSKSKKII